jgi:hypothetical protein
MEKSRLYYKIRIRLRHQPPRRGYGRELKKQQHTDGSFLPLGWILDFVVFLH